MRQQLVCSGEFCVEGGAVKRKKASQASWALVTEGVATARVEAHRLRHVLNRALRLVKDSDERDHLHQVAGDLILAGPQRLDALEKSLDRASYILSVMGKNHLRNRLTSLERSFVDDAVQGSTPFNPIMVKASAERVARRYLAKLGDE